MQSSGSMLSGSSTGAANVSNGLRTVHVGVSVRKFGLRTTADCE